MLPELLVSRSITAFAANGNLGVRGGNAGVPKTHVVALPASDADDGERLAKDETLVGSGHDRNLDTGTSPPLERMQDGSPQQFGVVRR